MESHTAALNSLNDLDDRLAVSRLKSIELAQGEVARLTMQVCMNDGYKNPDAPGTASNRRKAECNRIWATQERITKAWAAQEKRADDEYDRKHPQAPVKH